MLYTAAKSQRQIGLCNLRAKRRYGSSVRIVGYSYNATDYSREVGQDSRTMSEIRGTNNSPTLPDTPFFRSATIECDGGRSPQLRGRQPRGVVQRPYGADHHIADGGRQYILGADLNYARAVCL